MLKRSTVFEIHRLNQMGLSQRSIAERLDIDRKTVAQYIENPFSASKERKRKPGKLDPYREYIVELITAFPGLKAPVVLRRITEKGFDGEITIVRDLLRELKRESTHREAFIRFESMPGEQMQVDWGHFGTLVYGSTKRKLYALVVIESHSRMLYVKFTHSQKQEVLHQGLYEAFSYFGGSPKELVVDNMLTAVIERAGKVIRFNDAFLDFMMRFNINPVACNIKSPHEKGKVEASIKYIRHNFFPANTFTSLLDVQEKVILWLNQVANVRVHNTTGKRPCDVVIKDKLSSLPPNLPDLRETDAYFVHKDFCVRFDGNVYTVPPWTVGKKILLKADDRKVCLFYKDKEIAVHQRCWERHHRVEHQAHVREVKKLKTSHHLDRQTEVFLSLGSTAEMFLEKLSGTRKPLKKSIDKLLKLKDEYGEGPLQYALEKAISLNLYGADYVEHILYQEMTPNDSHPPVKLEKQSLNDIRLPTPSLKEYDAIAMKRRRKK